MRTRASQMAVVLTLEGGGEERVPVPGGKVRDGMFAGRPDVVGAAILPGVATIGKRAFEDCTALAGAFAEAAGEAGMSLRAADLFGLLQQALQTGPLQCSKPARFKRLLGTGASSEHANAVRRLLEAVAPMCLGEGAAAFTERQRDAICQWQAQLARTLAAELGSA